jgi:hypothetical protein
MLFLFPVTLAMQLIHQKYTWLKEDAYKNAFDTVGEHEKSVHSCLKYSDTKM